MEACDDALPLAVLRLEALPQLCAWGSGAPGAPCERLWG
jgi:hypothetical protein